MERIERVGLDSLGAVTALLQRARAMHPTFGLFEASDLQWWWRKPRPTDAVPQLHWVDDHGKPVAAVILTDWGDHTALDPFVLPGTAPEVLRNVMAAGLANAATLGIEEVGLEIPTEDEDFAEYLAERGFRSQDATIVECWIDADRRPAVTSITEGYSLMSRADAHNRPHHNVRSGPDIEKRLQQTSLYRADLDLVVYSDDGDVAGYGLFWFDPVTRTGQVEPMRTNDGHQRRGLARHVLTAGVDRLAAAGANRIKICYEDDNPASGPLYRDVGFEPFRSTTEMVGPTG